MSIEFKKEYMESIECHNNEAQKLLGIDKVLGVFLQGSQNYNMAYENSDVDSKCLVLPSFEDLALNKKAISTTHILDNEEHLDLKDVRLYFKQFLKQNINFVEVLFTPYCSINPLYQEEWNELVLWRERISHYNPVQTMVAASGMAAEKYHALEHPYKNKLAILEKFGYDPKQLHHLLRLKDFVTRYWDGECFESCLVPQTEKEREFLIEVKRGNVYTLNEAREVAVAALGYLEEKKNEARNSGLNKTDEEVEEFLDNMLLKIFRKILKKELEVK